MFVSSTCNDLKQVRADLKNFIECMGLYPIISNYDSFPVDPSVTAVDNCLQVVDERADLFLLIVGGRYGSINDHGKSITNMEYLRARAKGIPIYVFVQKAILNILPLWKANPDSDFTAVVDSSKLFAFVDSLMGVDGIWVFPFEFANEISDALRKQLAYLFKDALQLRSRAEDRGLPDALRQLQGVPLRLVIDRPPYWEFLLFAHVLDQEISRAKGRRFDLNFGIAFGQGEHLDTSERVFDWVNRKLAEQSRISGTMERIVNVALQDAFGPQGISGDPVKIVYATQRLGEAYRSAIEWAIETQRVSVQDRFQELVRVLGTFVNNMIGEIEDYSAHALRTIEAVIANPPGPNESREVNLTLKLTMSGVDEFREVCDKLSASL
jgi:hypothetical protein